MKRFLLLLMSSALYLPGAFSQIVSPTVGYVRFAEGLLRPVYGIEGNYVVGQDGLSHVSAASFSKIGGIVATPGALTLIRTDLTPAGNILLSEVASLVRIDRTLDSAIAWLPDSRSLVHWNGHTFVSLNIPGLPSPQTVRSLRKLSVDQASFIEVATDGKVLRVLVSLTTGDIVESQHLPGTWHAAFEDADGQLVCFTTQRLTVLSPDGNLLKSIVQAFDSDLQVEYSSDNCLHISSAASARDWLLHKSNADYRLYQLPHPNSMEPPK